MDEVDMRNVVNVWIEKYSDIFFSYVSRRVSDKTIVKDILQETFIAAWKNSRGFQNKADEKTWLFAILKNKLIDYYRSRAKVNAESFDANYFFDNVEHWTEKGAPIQWQGYNEALDRKEFYAILEICKSKLSEVQNLAFTMKYVDEFDSDFICKVLKITASNYWVLIHRSKLQLRSCLEKNWFSK